MKRLIHLFIITCLIFSISAQAFAFGQAGSGDQSGGGSEAPVEVKLTYPQNKATNFPVGDIIMFGFNKNVVHFSINKANRDCFKMVDSQNQAVAFTVVMADDQVEPQKRRDIGIKPKSPLKSGEHYIVTVSKNLSAKSGDTMLSDYVLEFTTEGIQEENVVIPPPPEPPTEPTVKPAEEVQVANSTETSVSPSPTVTTSASPQVTESPMPIDSPSPIDETPALEENDGNNDLLQTDQDEEVINVVAESSPTSSPAISPTTTEPPTPNPSQVKNDNNITIYIIVAVVVLVGLGIIMYRKRGKK